MTRAYAIALIAFTLAACRGVAEDRDDTAGRAANIEERDRRIADTADRLLEITTVEDTLVAGASAEIRLENLSDRTVGFNLCPKVLERRSGDAWTELPETRPEACTMELHLLGAGETVLETTALPSGLAPGTYRIVFEGISFEEGDREVPLEDRTSNAFEIG